jgi:hypothetical protein
VRFRAAWEHQLQKKGPKEASLFAACASTVGPLFLAALPFKLLNDASQFVGPVILNRLLTVVAGQAAKGGNLAAASVSVAAAASSSMFNATAAAVPSAAAAAVGGDDWTQWLQWLEAPLSNGYCLAFLLFFGTTFGVLADNQHFQRVMRAGFRLKAVVTAEVYRKVSIAALFFVICSGCFFVICHQAGCFCPCLLLVPFHGVDMNSCSQSEQVQDVHHGQTGLY